MADAELGVVVSVQGASEGAAQLDKFALSAKGAAASTTDLSNARAKAEAQWTNLTGVKTAATETTKLGVATAATGQSMGIFQRAIAAISNVFSPYGKQAEGASINLNHLAGAHGEVAKGMHLVNAVAYSTGSSIQGIGQFAMLARGGLEVLALGLTATLIVSLEKSADAVKLLQDRFAFFKGETGAQQAMDQIRMAADKTGASVATLGDLTQSLSEKLGSQKTGWINPPGMDKAPTIINAINEALVRSGKDADTATALVKKYADQIGELDPVTNKYLGMTQKLFDQIRKDSPELAGAIAAAFGHPILDFDKQMGLQRFSDWLKTSPQNINQLVFAMQRMPAEIAKIKLEPNVSQSWVSLKNSVLNLWSELGKSEGGSMAKNAIDGITKSIKELDAAIKGGDVGKKLMEMISGSLNAPENDLMGKFVTTMIEGIKKQLNDFADHPIDRTIDWLALLGPADGWEATIKRVISTVGGAVNGAVDGVIQGISAMVNAAVQKILQLVQLAATAIANLFSKSPSGNAPTTSDYASTQPGVSFVAPSADSTMNDPTLQGFATGGTFKVGGSGAQTPVNFMGTPGEIVSVTPVGGNAGSVFQVGGLGGVDSTLVQFSATPGSTVTITPVGLTAPQSQGLGPVSGLTTHVPGMATLALGGAVVNQASTTTAAAASATAAASANPYSMFGVGSTGDAKIAPWKGNPAGTMSDYVPLSQIYASAKSDAQNFGQAPTQNATSNAYYSQYGIDQYIASGPNAATGTSKGIGSSSSQVSPYGAGNFTPDMGGDIPSGGYSDTYYGGSYDPNSDPNNWATYVGDYQTGGSFKIRGGGAPDSKMVAMRLSPDENVVISRPNAGKSDKAMNVTLNINGNISPLAFVAAEAQVKRAARRIFS
jgi:hypothetical protein